MKKIVKSALRYPGGKSRLLKHIDPLIPQGYDEYRDLFVGGGSVALLMAHRNPDAQISINDLNVDLIAFYRCLKERFSELRSILTQIRALAPDGRALHAAFRSDRVDCSGCQEVSAIFQQFGSAPIMKRAVRFFVMNRITFSGTTDSGGYSQQAFDTRFTASSLDRLVPMAKAIEKMKISHNDYSSLLDLDFPENGKRVFLFMDPPYLTASNLYGNKGDLHHSFDHKLFANQVRACHHDWLITYDDSPIIRDLFSWADITEWSPQYAMNNWHSGVSKKGCELFISNKKKG